MRLSAQRRVQWHVAITIVISWVAAVCELYPYNILPHSSTIHPLIPAGQVVREGFNPEAGLFRATTDNRLYPNPHAQVGLRRGGVAMQGDRPALACVSHPLAWSTHNATLTSTPCPLFRSWWRATRCASSSSWAACWARRCTRVRRLQWLGRACRLSSCRAHLGKLVVVWWNTW